MRLPFNPSRVDSSGKPDHSRGLHPGLFYSTLSASVLWVMVGAVPENRGRHSISLPESESESQSVSTCDIDSDIDPDPEDPPQYHPVGVEQLSPGCKPRGMQQG